MRRCGLRYIGDDTMRLSKFGVIVVVDNPRAAAVVPIFVLHAVNLPARARYSEADAEAVVVAFEVHGESAVDLLVFDDVGPVFDDPLAAGALGEERLGE